MKYAHILLVEDDDVLRSVVERNLVVRGHHVCIATTAEEALQQLRSSTFDLILLDINLPDQTGWDILRALPPSMPRINGKLPVVVLSAVRVSPQRLAEFAPLAYLPKPFPISSVLERIEESIALQDVQRNITLS